MQFLAADLAPLELTKELRRRGMALEIHSRERERGPVGASPNASV
jgi:hypothetical protein